MYNKTFSTIAFQRFVVYVSTVFMSHVNLYLTIHVYNGFVKLYKNNATELLFFKLN